MPFTQPNIGFQINSKNLQLQQQWMLPNKEVSIPFISQAESWIAVKTLAKLT